MSVLVCFSERKDQKRIMTWLCLEFCDDTAEITELNFKQLSDHKDIISAVSFEKYTLGPNSSLVDNNLTEVASRINGLNLEAWPLLSSFPHPPEFIDWMRQVFANPQPFINSCVLEAQRYGYVGYNLDWEPTDDVTSEDGEAYSVFIDTFAKGLQQANLRLTVDIATWSPIWNYTTIASSGALERGISMGTYTSSDSSFSKQLDTLITAFGPGRAGVGLEVVNASSGALLPLEEVQWRFEQIASSGATEVDLWRMPVPKGWWPMLTKFAHS
ncbi:hypothetical protein EON65_43485 [archaeon]|nr:MAG: hypothetical protein EON65_43485 [archaeon]